MTHDQHDRPQQLCFTGRRDLVELWVKQQQVAHYSLARGAIGHDDFMRSCAISTAIRTGGPQ